MTAINTVMMKIHMAPRVGAVPWCVIRSSVLSACGSPVALTPAEPNLWKRCPSPADVRVGLPSGPCLVNVQPSSGGSCTGRTPVAQRLVRITRARRQRSRARRSCAHRRSSRACRDALSCKSPPRSTARSPLGGTKRAKESRLCPRRTGTQGQRKRQLARLDSSPHARRSCIWHYFGVVSVREAATRPGAPLYAPPPRAARSGAHSVTSPRHDWAQNSFQNEALCRRIA